VIIAYWRLVRCVRRFRSTVNSLAKKTASSHGEELTTDLSLENHQPVTSGGTSQCLPKQGQMVLAGNLRVVEEV
jgi:hypothetical protein